MTEVLYFEPIAQHGSGFPDSFFVFTILLLTGIMSRKVELQVGYTRSIVSADFHKGAFSALWVEV